MQAVSRLYEEDKHLLQLIEGPSHLAQSYHTEVLALNAISPELQCGAART